MYIFIRYKKIIILACWVVQTIHLVKVPPTELVFFISLKELKLAAMKQAREDLHAYINM